MRQVTISYILPLLILLLTVETHAHNVTRLLANRPFFSSFNHYLTQTRLADEINQRTSITVCAVDNAAMSALISKGYTNSTLRNILSLHVLFEYFDARTLVKLDGSTLVSTLSQVTGAVPGTTGLVNITNRRGGRIEFRLEGGDISPSYVRSIRQVRYDISIIQISSTLLLDIASAPPPAPSAINVSGIISARG